MSVSFSRSSLSTSRSLQGELTQKITYCTTAQEILDLWRRNKDSFNEVNFAVACNHLAKKKLKQNDTRDLQEMVKAVATFLPRMTNQNIANMANGLSKWPIEKRAPFRDIATEIKDRVRKRSDFAVKEVSLLLNAFARSKQGDRETFSSLASVLPTSAARVDPRDLTQIASSISEIDYQGDEFFLFLQANLKPEVLTACDPRTLSSLANNFTSSRDVVEAEVLRRNRYDKLKKFNFLDISNLVHGLLKKQKNPNREVARALSDVLSLRYKENQLQDFSFQALANIANGFAYAGFEDEKNFVLEIIAKAVVAKRQREGRSLAEENSLHLSSLVNDLANAEKPNAAFFATIAETLRECQQKATFDSFRPIDLALILKGFIYSGFENEEVLNILYNALRSSIQTKGLAEIDASTLSSIIYSFSRSTYDDITKFFPLFEEEIVKRLEMSPLNFELSQLKAFAISFATCNFVSETFFKMLEKIVIEFYSTVASKDISLRNFSTFVLAFSLSGFGSKELFQVFEKRLIEFRDRKEICEFSSLAISHCLLGFELSPYRSEKVFEILKDELLKRHAENDLGNFDKLSSKILIVAEKRQDKELFGLVKEKVLADKNIIKNFSFDAIGYLFQYFVTEEILDLAEERIYDLIKAKNYNKKFTRNINNIIEGYASSQRNWQGMMTRLKEVLLTVYKKNRFRNFTLKDLAQIAQSYRRRDFRADDLFCTLEEFLLDREKGSPELIPSTILSQFLLSFSVDYPTPLGTKKLYRLFEQHILRADISQISSQTISNMLLSFARVGHGTDELYEFFENEIVRRFEKDALSDFEELALRQSIYALTVCKRYKSRAFSHLVETLEKRAEVLSFALDSKAYMQLITVEQFITLKEELKTLFKGKLRQMLDSVDPKDVATDIHYSGKQKSFFYALKKVRSELTEEENYEKKVGILSVDILIEKEKRVFEYQGPRHYQYESKNFTGLTLFKLEHLALLGYRVTSIDYRDFQVARTENQGVDFARKALAEAG